METTDTTEPLAAINRDCTITVASVTSASYGQVTVDLTDDGRVRINIGATTLFLAGWDAELLSRELLSFAVRSQHQTEREQA